LRPRLRIETRGEGLHLVRVVDGERHWRTTREGAVAPVSEETLAIDRRWLTWIERASAVHGDVRLLPRLPEPIGMR